MHDEPGLAAGPQLAGITAECVLAALPFPAWICTECSLEILAANSPATAHLGCAVADLRGWSLAEPATWREGEHRLNAWAGTAADAETVWLLRRPAGGTTATRVLVRPLVGPGAGRLLVTVPPPVGGGTPAPAGRSEDDLLRDAKRESLELLAGGVAHDFNNLLTALIGNLSLARMDTELGVEVQEWLEEAEKAAGRARDLTQQLLTFVKGGEPVRRLVEVGGCLREAAQFARQGSRVRCEYVFAPDLWPAEVDAGQIGQVVHNLVLNAVQAMPRGGVVTVAARNVPRDRAHALGLGPHPFVVVEVRDEGPGIGPEDMARIFQPYFTTKPKGSGLGLATSQTIARRHFGALRVESRPGEGAAFLLYLPARPDGRVEKPGEAAALPSLRGRVLFMDDEVSICQMMPSLLRRIGFETEVVTDGRAAVDCYGCALEQGRPFDVVILDLTVPAGMGGLEAAQHLRALDPKARVLVSSGYAGDPVLRDFREHGFLGMLTKPFCLGDLASELGRVLEGLPVRS